MTLDSESSAEEKRAIKAARAQSPRKLHGAKCDIWPTDSGLNLRLLATAPTGPSPDLAIIELPNKSIWVSPSELSVTSKGISVVSDLIPEDAKPFALNRSDIRLSVMSGGEIYEAQGCKAL